MTDTAEVAPEQVAPLPRRRPPMVIIAVVVVLALLILAVWGAGGFELRRDQVTRVAPGTLLAAGPYEVTFTKAEVQYVQDDQYYSLTVLGTGRTTAATSMAPSTFDSFTQVQDLQSKTRKSVESYRYGEGTDTLFDADAFTPGLAPVTFVAAFKFEEKPGPELRLLVFDLDFTDNSILQNQDPSWHLAPRAWDMILPVTELPDRKY